ncbi:MAG: DUF4198 domain-containing protein [Nitrospinae bacterium]|nr:DUF4198 domain-containing protein [Nitrospinota bacterium]
MRKRIVFFVFFGCIFMLELSFAYAHDYWIERKGRKFVVVYGHGNKREEFDSSKVKSVNAFDFQGKEIDITKEGWRDGLLLKTSEQPSLIFLEVDDGYWSKTIYGWKNLPKRNARRVVESVRSLYYSKAIISWSDMTQGLNINARLDIIPIKNPFSMKVGDTLRLKVLYNKRPLAGIDVEENHEKAGTTDREGAAEIQLSKGNHVITVRYKEPIENDPDAQYLSITSTLSFESEK